MQSLSSQNYFARQVVQILPRCHEALELISMGGNERVRCRERIAVPQDTAMSKMPGQPPSIYGPSVCKEGRRLGREKSGPI